MHPHILLVLVFAILAQSGYKTEASGVSFSDDASLSAGSKGIKAGFEKKIGLSIPKPQEILHFLGMGDKSSKSGEMGLGINGGLAIEPKFTNDGLGVSFGGSGGMDIGISDRNDKGYSEEWYRKHKIYDEYHKSSHESNEDDGKTIKTSGGELGDVGLGFGGNAGLGISFGTGGVSADLGGQISAGKSSGKYDDKYGSQRVHENNQDGSKTIKGEAGGSIIISHDDGDNKEHHSEKGSAHIKGGGIISHGDDHTNHDNINGGNYNGNQIKNSTTVDDYGILNDGKCGRNIKLTLEYIRTFIESCHVFIHLLLQMKDADLLKVLCHILPSDSKLDCQLGCSVIPRFESIYNFA